MLPRGEVGESKPIILEMDSPISPSRYVVDRAPLGIVSDEPLGVG
jgi:hypothetical protein